MKNYYDRDCCNKCGNGYTFRGSEDEYYNDNNYSYDDDNCPCEDKYFDGYDSNYNNEYDNYQNKKPCARVYNCEESKPDCGCKPNKPEYEKPDCGCRPPKPEPDCCCKHEPINCECKCRIYIPKFPFCR